MQRLGIMEISLSWVGHLPTLPPFSIGGQDRILALGTASRGVRIFETSFKDAITCSNSKACRPYTEDKRTLFKCKDTKLPLGGSREVQFPLEGAQVMETIVEGTTDYKYQPDPQIEFTAPIQFVTEHRSQSIFDPIDTRNINGVFGIAGDSNNCREEAPPFAYFLNEYKLARVPPPEHYNDITTFTAKAAYSRADLVYPSYMIKLSTKQPKLVLNPEIPKDAVYAGKTMLSVETDGIITFPLHNLSACNSNPIVRYNEFQVDNQLQEPEPTKLDDKREGDNQGPSVDPEGTATPGSTDEEEIIERRRRLLTSSSSTGIDFGSLIAPESSWWSAVVDTQQRCLVLPAFMWSKLMRRLSWDDEKFYCEQSSSISGFGPRDPPPLDLSDGTDKDSELYERVMQSKLCYVHRSYIDSLPDLTFNVGGDGSGNVLRIPLRDLVLVEEEAQKEEGEDHDDNGGSKNNDDKEYYRLCVMGVQGFVPLVHRQPHRVSSSPSIVLGTLALKRLEIYVDSAARDIYLRQFDLGDGEGVRDMCESFESRCEGDEVFNRYYNRCDPANCQMKLFSSWDSDLKHCDIQPVVPLVFGSLIAVLTIIHLSTKLQHWRWVDNLVRND